ncbi:flagellar hook-associated protein FlgK [Bradyrhizobium sp.]|uniref:flagellar hook-associated protein FlgK n=1 Tax=Bradyrhizobium sp. TaxID=376 RepID=UPI002C26A306|nr:flagellar hook-associated protein FlgK [Bradyrhizobium sp.]HWX60251.1 flagellar hook-associated protein FlgK [Bradyrhizobium sp.]
MGLSSALATAMSGLRSTQAALSIISSNVGNAQTPGYVTQNPNQIEVGSGGFGASVETTGVNRQLDLFVQGQLRTEIGGGAYADQINNILGQLQSVYGTPGGDGTLETALSNFTSALQSLSSNPGNGSAQSVALSAAQSLAQQLNSTTQGIQSLRTNVDQDIGNSAAKANTDLTQIAQLNIQIQGLSPTDPQAATLMDQRDSAVSDLAKLIDVKVVTDGSNQASVFTNSGIQLVGNGYASQLIVNTPGALTAGSLYNSNPAQSGVSSLNIRLPSGALIDAVGSNAFSSGQIAADIKLRDQTLTQAQTQVDQLAATLSSSLSDVTTAGTAVTGPPAGFSVDTTNVLAGNTINLTYTDSATNTQHQISIVNVTDPAALPLQNAANANPQRVGVNFSLGMASVVTQLNTALGGAGLVFSNPSGATLNVVGSATATVNAASTTTTTQSLASGSPQLPLFTDSNALYTGAITASGSQMQGLAGRITVNPAVLANRSALSVYSTSPVTPSGDNTRSDFLFSQLTSATFSVSPQTGLGSAAQPFKSTVSDYLQQFISQQSNSATLAKQLQQGQSVVVSTLQQKFDSTSAVNIDTEMSNLIQVQNTYAANAHIMSVVQSMMQSLLQAQG